LDLEGPPTNGTASPFSTLDSDDDRGAQTEHVSWRREHDGESYHDRRNGAGQYHGRMPSLEAGLKRLNYYLIENLETGKDLQVIRWVHGSSDSPVLCLRLKGTRPMINEVSDMLHRAPLTTPTTLSEEVVHDISRALLVLLSDVFALYLKTNNPLADVGLAFPRLSFDARRSK
jgi:hypothetical protein